MEPFILQFTLQSAATFGRGDGVAGLVDEEIEHDADGLPYLRGRTLKGLLAEECANVLYALELQGKAARWRDLAYTMFGKPGSLLADIGTLRVGDARLPDELRQALKAIIARKEMTIDEVLAALTSIRRQTSLNEYGGPERGSLRSMRVILPGTTFEAMLEFSATPDKDALALLSACVLAWRRAGMSRNRGRGRLVASLLDSKRKDVTADLFRAFAREVNP